MNDKVFNKKGYVVALVDVLDAQGYEEYKKLSSVAVEEFGGRFVVRGGQHEILEGDLDPKRVAILEFDSYQQAKNFYDSASYQKAVLVRKAVANSRFFLVEGV